MLPDETLVHCLVRRAAETPDRVAFRFVGLAGEEDEVTFAMLLRDASAVAAALAARGVTPGARVVLMLPTNLDFLRVLYGVMLAGAVPVPVYPPMTVRRLQAYLATLRHVLGCAAPALTVVPEGLDQLDPDTLADLTPRVGVLLNGRQLVAEAAGCGAGETRLPGADAIGLIQFSSGSTAMPKGVVLSHGNLMENLRAIGSALRLTPASVGVCWLPLYHDMGLIGFAMGGLACGPEVVLMRPTDFLQRPALWLRTISRHRGTITGAPQFAYALALQRVRDEELEGLDLSSLETMLVGAEPLVHETLDRFAARLAAHGLRREAIVTCYGLAENALAVSFGLPDARGPRALSMSRRALATTGRVTAPQGADDTVVAVSSGRPIANTRLRIATSTGAEARPGEVGEVCIRGSSTCRGVLTQEGLTPSPTEWLPTGDLGTLVDGELFITARLKDLIIVAGRNYYPPDLEQAVGDLPGLRPGRVVAIGLPHAERGTETVAIVAETKLTERDALRRLVQAVRSRLVERAGVRAGAVVLVPRGEIPLTSSGKVQRREVRERCLAGTLTRLPTAAPAPPATDAAHVSRDLEEGRRRGVS